MVGIRTPGAALKFSMRRFAEEYVQTPEDSVGSAIRSGIDLSKAKATAHRWLARRDVREYIQYLRKDALKKVGITEARILQELAQIAFSNLQDVMEEDENGNMTINLKRLSRGAASPITEIVVDTSTGKVQTKRVRVKLADKITALINLGKHYGMFKEQVEHSGSLTLEQLVVESMKDAPATKDETPVVH